MAGVARMIVVVEVYAIKTEDNAGAFMDIQVRVICKA